MTEPRALIESYYAAFNRGDIDGMLACVAENLAHDVNQGPRRHGREAFAEFCRELAGYYREQLSQIVIMIAEDGRHAAAEFMVDGEYLATAPDLPPANGQRYRLPAGTFFTLDNGKISRITTYYNLQDWLAQVVGHG